MSLTPQHRASRRPDRLPGRHPGRHPSFVGLLAGLLLVALAAPAWSAQGVQRVTLDPQAEARAGVRTSPVTSISFGDRLRVVGRTVRSPGTTVTIKALLEGRVEALYVAPGDRVAAGAPLVLLHSHDLHSLKSSYQRTREGARLAANRVAAGEQLLALEGISRIELEQRQQQALAARLEVEAVEAELEHLGFRRQEVARLFGDPAWEPRLTLRAPAAGVVLDLEVETYGWVERLAPLLTIGDPASLELELQVPPDRAHRVQPGDLVEFVPVGRPELASRARVVTRVPAVDPTTRTVTVRAEIIEGREQYFPGIFVEGEILHAETRTAPAVPVAAVIRIDGQDHVFVRSGPSSYDARPVVTGRADGDRYEILSGLALGEEVAVGGVFLLKSALVRAGGA